MNTPESNGFDWTTVAAWWGCVVATGVAGFDVYKYWFSGARLKLTATYRPVTFLEQHGVHEQTFKVVIKNRGGKATSPESIKVLDKQSRKAKYERIITETIEPGRFLKASYVIEELLINEGDICSVSHSESDKPVESVIVKL